jgi:hypothetical protein
MSFASKRLPELAELFFVGERNIASQNFGVPKDSVFPSQLVDACLCDLCKGTWSLDYEERMICLERVALTIFKYIWLLSWLDISEGLSPSASGLRALYLRSRIE